MHLWTNIHNEGLVFPGRLRLRGFNWSIIKIYLYNSFLMDDLEQYLKNVCLFHDPISFIMFKTTRNWPQTYFWTTLVFKKERKWMHINGTWHNASSKTAGIVLSGLINMPGCTVSPRLVHVSQGYLLPVRPMRCRDFTAQLRPQTHSARLLLLSNSKHCLS